MRRYKRARPKWKAWVFAVLVPVLFLFALFSLLPYEVMVKRWPFGIRNTEVMAYQPWFDQRPGQSVDVTIADVELTGSGANAQWKVQDASAPAQVVAQDGRIDVSFKGGDRADLVLRPADIGNLRDLYVKVLADTLGVYAPAIELVRLVQDGSAEGVHLQEARPMPGQVLGGAPADALLLQRGDKEHPVQPMAGTGEPPAAALGLRTSAEDDSLWGAYALLLYAIDRTDVPAGDAAFCYDPVLGRVLPLYSALPVDTTGASERPLARFARERLRAPGTMQAMRSMAERIRRDSVLWVERLGLVDARWEPALADGRSLGLTGAATRAQRMDFLARVFHPEPEAFFGEPLQDAVGEVAAAASIPAWMERFRSQPDTIRLPRGKYEVNADIILSAGTSLVLERGARLFLSPGVRLVIDGALHARGTALNPVFIRPADESRPYGGIIVRGMGGTPCSLRGVRMSGGAGSAIDGVYYGGSLSFVRCDVHLQDSDLEAPGQDALLEVRRGAVGLVGVRFGKGGKAGARLVDVNGSVRNCTFADGAAGLEVDGGEVTVDPPLR